MKIKVGDKVKVITGSEKGKEGKVIKTFKAENKIIIEGLNLIKKHLKPNGAEKNGGIIDREAKINASNVKVISNTKKEEKPTKELKPKVTKKKKEK